MEKRLSGVFEEKWFEGLRQMINKQFRNNFELSAEIIKKKNRALWDKRDKEKEKQTRSGGSYFLFNVKGPLSSLGGIRFHTERSPIKKTEGMGGINNK